MMEKKKRTVEELLLEIKNLPPMLLDKDPDFITDYMMGKIIENILIQLEIQGISQTEFAKKLGKSRQYVSWVLGEKVNFTIKSLAQISCALNCKLDITMQKNDVDIQNTNIDNIISLPSGSYSTDIEELHDVLPEQIFAKEKIKKQIPTTSDVNNDSNSNFSFSFA